jgi:hypothetical protein
MTGTLESTKVVRRRGLLWLGFGLVVVMAAILVAVWYFWMGNPVVTFDGENVSYRGSTTFDVGVVDFTLDSTDYDKEAAFILARLRDSTITDEEIRQFTEENPASQVPPFVAEHFPRFLDGEVVEARYTVSTAGDWAMFATTAPDDSDEGFFVMRIHVE